MELKSALKNGIPVIPVLIGDCQLPSSDDIPRDLKWMLKRQVIRLRTDPDWDTDMLRLIRDLKEVRASKLSHKQPAKPEQKPEISITKKESISQIIKGGDFNPNESVEISEAPKGIDPIRPYSKSTDYIKSIAFCKHAKKIWPWHNKHWELEINCVFPGSQSVGGYVLDVVFYINDSKHVEANKVELSITRQYAVFKYDFTNSWIKDLDECLRKGYKVSCVVRLFHPDKNGNNILLQTSERVYVNTNCN